MENDRAGEQSDVARAFYNVVKLSIKEQLILSKGIAQRHRYIVD